MQLQPSISKKDFINTFLLTVLYGLGAYGIQAFLFKTGTFTSYPTAENLVSWDADWYRSIGENGYTFNTQGQSNSGFFYLLPAIWHITGFNGWGISLLNLCFFATGFSLLSNMLSLPSRDKILWLSTPVVFFAFVPYAEGLFFLLSTLCILGITAQKTWLIWVSLFLLSLTRASVLFVIPAFLCMELIAAPREKWLQSLYRYLHTYVLPALAGLALFIVIQYRQTHVWFAYFIAQSRFWKREYNNPVFPLINSTGNETTWLNSVALFVCFTAFVLAFAMALKWLIKNKQQGRVPMLSMGYLGITLLSSLCYSPQWKPGQTDIIGSFRYAMLNPFFFVFLYYFTHRVAYKWQHYLLMVLFASGVWMAFGAYLHLQAFLLFSFNTCMVAMYMLHSNRRLEWPAMIITAINVLVQVLLFQHYLCRTSLVD